jgi:hypothetical protein
MAVKPKVSREADDDDQPGACYIADKQTGQQVCHYLTKTACADQGGVFYGGPCGPLDDILPVDAARDSATKKKAVPRKSASRKKRPK